MSRSSKEPSEQNAVQPSAVTLQGLTGSEKPAVPVLQQKQAIQPPVTQLVSNEEFDANLAKFQRSLAAVKTNADLKKLFDDVKAGDSNLADDDSFAEITQCDATTQLVLRSLLGKEHGLKEANDFSYGMGKETTATFDKKTVGTFQTALTKHTRAVATVKWLEGTHTFSFIHQNNTIYVLQGWASRYTIAAQLNKAPGYIGNYNQVLDGAAFTQFLNMMTNNPGDKGAFTVANSFGKDVDLRVSPSWTYSIVPAAAPAKSEAEEKELVPESVKKDLAKKANQKKSGSKCFITAACIRTKGLPDDCEELMVLRWFRDNILLHRSKGKQLIDLYYQYAPAIVQQIDDREDADNRYQELYSVILSCVKAIRKKQYTKAYNTYCEMIMGLKKEYLPVIPVHPCRSYSAGFCAT